MDKKEFDKFDGVRAKIIFVDDIVEQNPITPEELDKIWEKYCNGLKKRYTDNDHKFFVSPKPTHISESEFYSILKGEKK